MNESIKRKGINFPKKKEIFRETSLCHSRFIVFSKGFGSEKIGIEAFLVNFEILFNTTCSIEFLVPNICGKERSILISQALTEN